RTGVGEAELKHFHAGNLKAIAQFGNVGGYQAQVFGDEGQVAKRGAQHVKEIIFGAIYPSAMDGRGFAGGNLPVLLKAAKVIEPHVIAGGERPSHALDPPVVSARLE